ncbi:MAG: hypothetical protein V1645_01745, partial [archaeon]
MENEVLKFYSRKDIQKEMLRVAKNREVAVQYSDKGFGKRPDILQFPGDILDLVRSGATSFHISEERWTDPLQLKPGMTKKQLDDLRSGWDLIIDIDCKDLEYSKIAANLIIQALEFHNVRNVSVKFSGNKGLHIAVPFEAFPEKVEDKPTRLLFPDGPKIIALYLGNMIKERLAAEFLNYAGSIENLAKNFEKEPKNLEEYICPTHRIALISKTKQDLGLVCPKCGGSDYVEFRGGIYACSKCPNTLMNKTGKGINMQMMECPICKKREYETRFNPFAILSIDTVLISNRHMFRMPYSYHEKSGLISIPIRKEDVLNFKREWAKMENVKIENDFLNLEKESDASQLIVESFDWWTKMEKNKPEKKEGGEREYEELKEAIAEENFPPCIKLLAKGVSQDGRKRALFILINFLQNVGWD